MRGTDPRTHAGHTARSGPQVVTSGLSDGLAEIGMYRGVRVERLWNDLEVWPRWIF